MKCELHITSGARAGQREVFDKSYIGLGRHPLSDVRFDAEKDLDASTRHAAIVKTGENYVLRDLGSTNGTFVNGERLEADRPLRDGDVMRFGVHGPEVSFHVVREASGEEVVMPAVHAPPKTTSPTKPETPALTPAQVAEARRPKPERDDSVTPAVPIRAPKAPPSKTAVLRAELGQQQSRFRVLALTVLLVVVGAVAVVYWQARTNNEVIAGQDTVITRISAELAALRRVAAQTDSQKAELESLLRAERDPTRQANLRTQIATVERRSTAIQAAQAVDYNAIQRANTAAVAAIYVRYPDSTMYEGTAFSVNAQGQLLTNKHNVVNSAGVAARDIAIRFSGTTDVLPARVVRAAPDADVAVLQLESAGPFPAVQGLDESPTTVGSPVALIGFPGGTNNAERPRAKLVSGSIVTVSDSTLELDAFSGTGASGSPIFNSAGRVIGILYGGRGGPSSSEIVGLPIRRARGLLTN